MAVYPELNDYEKILKLLAKNEAHALVVLREIK